VPQREAETEVKSPATKLYREVEPDPVQERWERVQAGLMGLAKSQRSGAPPRPLAVWAFHAARDWDPADPRAGSVAELLRGIDPERVPPLAAEGPAKAFLPPRLVTAKAGRA
jgi:hypothetical protein